MPLFVYLYVLSSTFSRYSIKMNSATVKKLLRRDTRKIITDLKLPPINNVNGVEVKTIIDTDPDFYTMVDGRPIKSEKSIRQYKEHVKDVALKRALSGFLKDETLRITREMETESEIYKTAAKNFDDYKSSFDKFLAHDNNQTIQIMQKSDALAKDLGNITEDHKQANYEMASLKSKLQYIDETLLILLSFQNFLHRMAPILWQQSNMLDLDTKHSEILNNIESDLFTKIDIEYIKLRLDCLPPPKLYFSKPEQLINIFNVTEKQNLNYLLATEELNAQKNKFLKVLDQLKELLRHELLFINQKINEIQEVIVWYEAREEELKLVFNKVLNEKIRELVISKPALQIYNYVEFAFEQLFAPNETKLSPLDMLKTMEAEFENTMLELSVFDVKELKLIEKETYERSVKELKESKVASKLLKDVDKLQKRLKSSYEPSRQNHTF